jgi:mannose-6-phosphate isomerase
MKLPPSLREKIWGNRDLSPIFGPQPKPIGEAWYTFEENVIANGAYRGRTLGEVMALLGPRLMGRRYRASGLRRTSAGQGKPDAALGQAYFPILSKLLFTADRLSVQVHPDDAYALRHDGGPGKTEMWFVVHAAAGASVALGLTKQLTPEAMRAAAEDGTIEQFLRWVPVLAGQTLFVEPGTLHSIGPGLVLWEIQQNSDLTYRFFDFGRLGDDGKTRPLHIGQAVAVTKQEAHPGPTPAFRFPGAPANRELLAACPYFAGERLEWEGTLDYTPDADHADLLMFLRGEGRIGEDVYAAGDAYLIPAEAPPFAIAASSRTEVIRSYVPDLDVLRKELLQAGANLRQVQRLVPTA